MSSRSLVVYITPYAITLSTLYLFGYWDGFGVNIFEHLGITEVIAISLNGLFQISLPFVTALLFGLAIGAIKSLLFEAEPSGYIPLAEKDDLIVRMRFFLVGLSSFCIVLAGFIAVFADQHSKFFVVSGLLAVPCFIFVVRAKVIYNLFPKTFWYQTLGYGLYIALIMSYGLGAMNAENKKLEESYVIINKYSDMNNNVYVGSAGDRIFLWDKVNNKTTILSSTQVTSIEYKHELENTLLEKLYSLYF